MSIENDIKKFFFLNTEREEYLRETKNRLRVTRKRTKNMVLFACFPTPVQCKQFRTSGSTKSKRTTKTKLSYSLYYVSYTIN